MSNESRTIEVLRAEYVQKDAKYRTLCDATASAFEAHQAIKAMCDAAMAESLVAGEALIKALAEQTNY